VGWSADSRLAERIRERVAQVVLFELQDPRIAFTTITRVRLAKDNSTCEVYYSVLGSDGDRSKTRHALNDARGHVQREVGRILRTRTVPRLSFTEDPSIEGQFRLEGLLKGIESEREANPGDAEASAAAAGERPDGEAEDDADADDEDDGGPDDADDADDAEPRAEGESR
jgi:ribosome-binding factor A